MASEAALDSDGGRLFVAALVPEPHGPVALGLHRSALRQRLELAPHLMWYIENTPNSIRRKK